MLNKTKIDWANYTWNPITGCKRGCAYCYAKKMRARFMPEVPWDTLMYFDERLEDPIKIKKPSKIFVGSMSDIEYWPKYYMGYVLETIKKCPQHIFQFLTKNGRVYEGYDFPLNCWLGVTWTGNESDTDWTNKLCNQENGWKGKKNIKFISHEPLLKDNVSYMSGIITPDWLIMGGLTPKPMHKMEWVKAMVDYCSVSHIPIFLKNNLHYPIKIQEYPRG